MPQIFLSVLGVHTHPVHPLAMPMFVPQAKYFNLLTFLGHLTTELRKGTVRTIDYCLITAYILGLKFTGLIITHTNNMLSATE